MYTLNDIKTQRLSFRFGETELWLRFDMNAMREAESAGADPLSMLGLSRDKARVCFKVGIADCISAMDVPDGYADKVFNALDREEVTALIREGVLLALPPPVIGAKPKKNARIDYFAVFCLFCDVMGKSEECFWKSTLREILARWEKYAEFMGYKKPAERIAEFEDEA